MDNNMPIHKGVDKKFFENWKPEMAYVLGFFTADGSITVNPRGSNYFALQITDRSLLLKMRDVMRSGHKVSVREPKNGERPRYRLQIGSKKICNDLRKMGVPERKTYTIRLPEIPWGMFGEFLRGYFDGDGNVWIGYVHKDRTTALFTIQTVFTSCSKRFLSDLRDTLRKHGVTGGTLCATKTNAFRLQYGAKNSMLLYALMYDNLNNELFLRRKRSIFEKYKKVRKL